MRGPAFILALVVAASAAKSAGAAPTVAVAPVQGPKKSGTQKIEKALRLRLAEADIQLVAEKQLQSAAKKAGSDPGSAKAAEMAGADLLLVVTVKKAGKKFLAEAKLLDVAQSAVIDAVQKPYKKGGAQKAGDAIANDLMKSIVGFKPEGGASADEDKASSKKSKIVAPKEESDEPEPSKTRAVRAGEAPPRETGSVKPKDEDRDAPATATTVRPAGGEISGEQKVLQIGLGIGTQVGSAYTVTVGSQPTGLAYNLNPLVMLGGRARLELVDIGLGLELDLTFVPVKYNVDVNPQVTPNTPGGRFLNVGLTGFYELTAARFGQSEESRFYLAPLAGFVYTSLSVDPQMPYAVVISSSAFAPSVGGKVGLQLSSLTLEAIAKANIVVSYSESPQTTGQSGSGLGLYLGAGTRYWLSSTLGLSFNLGYDFMKVGLKGMGSRVPFANDPQLNNASVFSGNVKAMAGVVLAI